LSRKPPVPLIVTVSPGACDNDAAASNLSIRLSTTSVCTTCGTTWPRPCSLPAFRSRPSPAASATPASTTLNVYSHFVAATDQHAAVLGQLLDAARDASPVRADIPDVSADVPVSSAHTSRGWAGNER
jgi:hypothetical protein